MAIFTFDLQDATVEYLQNTQKEIEKEIQRRKSAEKSRLIENFKSAFLALQSAGIDVRCTDCVDEVDFRVNSWDNFYFD
jgi:hypothetical protein